MIRQSGNKNGKHKIWLVLFSTWVGLASINGPAFAEERKTVDTKDEMRELKEAARGSQERLDKTGGAAAVIAACDHTLRTQTDHGPLTPLEKSEMNNVVKTATDEFTLGAEVKAVELAIEAEQTGSDRAKQLAEGLAISIEIENHKGITVPENVKKALSTIQDAVLRFAKKSLSQKDFNPMLKLGRALRNQLRSGKNAYDSLIASLRDIGKKDPEKAEKDLEKCTWQGALTAASIL